MALEMDWKLSKAGVIVSILTAILGGVIWIGSELWKFSANWTATQMQITMLIQQNQNLTDALRQETAKREMDEQNTDRTILMIAEACNKR